MDLCDQLQSLKKDNLSMSQYVIKVKIIVYQSASVGEYVNEKDLILYLLGWLRLWCLSFKTNIQTREAHEKSFM